MKSHIGIASHLFSVLRRALLQAVIILSLTTVLCLPACGQEKPAPALDQAPAQEVEFSTADGIILSGHLFGSGDSAIVLAHMYPADQTSWFDFAAELAQEGYRALTFDFRGYGESQGSKDISHIDRDLLAAVDFVVKAGAKQVVLVGASMGGTASLIAAALLQSSSEASGSAPLVRGVITLSAPVEFKGLAAQKAVAELSCPLLFIAAEGDVGAESAREFAQLSSGRGDLLVVPGDEHGTNLLRGPHRDQVREAIAVFLNRCLSKE